jgi:hypothetical protein
MKKLFIWLEGHKKLLGLMTAGHLLKKIEELLFDWFLYGTVVAYMNVHFGELKGSVYAFLIMTPLSACICGLYLKVYNWSKKDWLGLEALKEFKGESNPRNRIEKIAKVLLQKSDIFAFFALSIWGDPFIVTLYLRKKSESYEKLSTKDLKIFWASVLFSNGYWTFRWIVIIKIFTALVGFLDSY